MAANDDRTKQTINAQRNKLRNHEQEKQPPERTKPKAKSEPKPPFKFQTIDNAESGIKDKPNQTTTVNEDPETTHEPKGPRGRPPNTQSPLNLLEKQLRSPSRKKLYMTPKRMRTEPELIGEKQQKDIQSIKSLAKPGWELSKTQSGQNAKFTQK